MFAFDLLVLREGNDVFGVLVAARVNEPKSLHVKHLLSVLHKMDGEVVLEHKELLFK